MLSLNTHFCRFVAQMWAFDQASRLRQVDSDLCMTAAAPVADKLFAGQRPSLSGAATDGDVVLQPCGNDVRQTFSMLSQSGASPSTGAALWEHLVRAGQGRQPPRQASSQRMHASASLTLSHSSYQLDAAEHGSRRSYVVKGLMLLMAVEQASCTANADASPAAAASMASPATAAALAVPLACIMDEGSMDAVVSEACRRARLPTGCENPGNSHY